MGMWNYRIIDFGTHKALHEVYYDDAGNPDGWTENPAHFVCDDEEDWTSITNQLAMAAYSAARQPVLRIQGGKLVSVHLVHKGDMTPMMIQAAEPPMRERRSMEKDDGLRAHELQGRGRCSPIDQNE